MAEGHQSSLIARRTPAAWVAVGVSLAVHAVLVGLLVGMASFEPPKLQPTQKPMNARVVRLGTKRDSRLLPRKEAPAPPPPSKKVEVPVPGAKPSPAKASEPQAASGKSKEDAKASRSRLFDAFAKTAERAEEPVGDPEGDPDGDADSAEEGERYFGLVLAKAKRHYGVTKTIPPQELMRLKATVILYIGPNGDLLKDPEIMTSSGNEQFDQDVILSLRKAAPFGPPPAHLVESLKTVGVAIEAKPF